MFFLVFAAGLGYLIAKKLDETDLYITEVPRKSRHKYREVQGSENVIQRNKPEKHDHKIEYTALGIPVKYHIMPNGTTIRTYGMSENQFNLDGV